MMLSHPQPLPPPMIPPPHPQPSLLFPPQHESRIIIQSIEPHPQPELSFTPHPQPVAVKSLIVVASKNFLFMVYTMSHGLVLFPIK